MSATADRRRSPRPATNTGKAALRSTWAPRRSSNCSMKLDLAEESVSCAKNCVRPALQQKTKDLIKPAENRRGDSRQRQQAGVDGAGRAFPLFPPDLRPLVLLDSGNFATSDLNDLYRPDHQPKQPAQEARRPQRAGSHRPQRKADAAAVGRRPVRQQSLQAARCWDHRTGRSSR